MKGTFHISLGGEHKIFTLWHHYTISNDVLHRDIWQYIQNLAIDPDEAYDKAKKIAGDGTVVWDVDEDRSILNKMGIRSSNKVFDGMTLTWGLKFNGQNISDILNDDFGLKYIALGYGFPARPRQCDLDCLAHTSNLPEVKGYLKDLEDEKKRKEIFAKMQIDTLKESVHVGTVDESLDIDVTVTGAYWIDGYYGSTFLIKMVDDENNRLSCFTTSKAFTGSEPHIFSNGGHPYRSDQVKSNDRLKISGIVKKHETRDERIKTEDTYVEVKDVKTTLITRIKKRGE